MFSITASSKTISVGESNNGRQPEMAAETGNTYISGSVTDSVEIPTSGIFDQDKLDKSVAK